MKETRKLYEHQEQDNDYNYYWFKNSDVNYYKGHNQEINTILERFKAREEQYMYIKGNYLYFSLNGAKFYVSLGVSEWEWYHIEELIEELKPLCEDIFYNPGELD